VRALAQLLAEGGQDARAGLYQHDARAGGVDAPEVTHQHRAADVRDGAGHLHSRGHGAHHHEGEQRALTLGVQLVLRLLEGAEDAAAQLRRLLQRLEARREVLPLRLAEVAVLGAAREHE